MGVPKRRATGFHRQRRLGFAKCSVLASRAPMSTLGCQRPAAAEQLPRLLKSINRIEKRMTKAYERGDIDKAKTLAALLGNQRAKFQLLADVYARTAKS